MPPLLIRLPPASEDESIIFAARETLAYCSQTFSDGYAVIHAPSGISSLGAKISDEFTGITSGTRRINHYR